MNVTLNPAATTDSAATDGLHRYRWPTGEIIVTREAKAALIKRERSVDGALWLAFRIGAPEGGHAPGESGRMVIAANGHYEASVTELCSEAGAALYGVLDVSSELVSQAALVPPKREDLIVPSPVKAPLDPLDARLVMELAGLAISPDPRACAPLHAHHAAGLLLVHALRRHCDLASYLTRPRKGGLAPWQLKKVTAHVEAHLHEPIAIEELQALVGLSSSYLIRSFRASMGVTPLAYIRARRLERARERLVGTDEPIDAIAHAAGFASAGNFATAFRNAFGQSPGQVRRSFRLKDVRSEASSPGFAEVTPSLDKTTKEDVTHD